MDMAKTMRILSTIFALEMLGRATDYLLGDVGSRPDSDADVWTPAVWGLTFLASAVLVLTGVLFREHRTFITGSLVGAASYLMFAYFQLRGAFDTYPPDDWRYFTAYLAFALFWVFATVSASLYRAVEHRLGEEGADGVD